SDKTPLEISVKHIIDPRSAYERYTTQGGIAVNRSSEEIDGRVAVEEIIDSLDRRRGVLLSSSYDYPGRYTRWDLGFSNPPVEVTSRDRHVTVRALNDRGKWLMAGTERAVASSAAVESLESRDGGLLAVLRAPSKERLPEEQRSKQPSVFSLIRDIIGLFKSRDDIHLGLYGAFGYDLALQF